MDINKIQLEYKNETNEEPMVKVTDGVHTVCIEVFNFNYVKWLEEKIINLQREKLINENNGSI